MKRLVAPGGPGPWDNPFPANNCPFCCSFDLTISQDTDSETIKHFVQCHKCGAHGPLSENEREAVEKWNDRERMASQALSLISASPTSV